MDYEHLRGLIAHNIAACRQTQERIIQIENNPEQRKGLRLFPTPEAAELIGISESHLRGLTQEGGDLHCGTVVGAGGRRAFALAEIHRVREALLEKTGDERYRRHRNKREKLQVLAIANFKGGAAKTTTAAHLGQYLAMRGYRVLLIDLDSQASLTGIFGFQPDTEIEAKDTLYPIFRGEKAGLDGIARETYWPGLDLVPASLGLYQSEFELPIRQRHEKGLRFWSILDETIRASCDGYDIVICDCPPSLGYMSINALCAATGMIVPMPPSMLDYASTGQFLQMTIDVFDLIRQYDQSRGTFDFFKVMVSKFKTEDRNQQEVARALRRNAGDLLLERAMAQTTGLDAAGNRKRTFYEIDGSSFPGNRKTYLRALEQLNLVNQEIENLLLQVWGREPLHADAAVMAAQ